MTDVFMIGIAGGSGSGKTTLTKAILNFCQEKASVIYHDNYYKAFNDLSYDERSRLNYDHPDAFDTDLLLEHLQALKQGQAVDCPVYDYSIHNRSDQTMTIRPNKIIIVEGILIFSDPRLVKMLDLKLFVDTDADVRILRRIRRDVIKRGRTLDSVTEQYLGTVKPMHELFVEPSKRLADIIIPEGGRNRVALDIIIKAIERADCKRRIQ